MVSLVDRAVRIGKTSSGLGDHQRETSWKRTRTKTMRGHSPGKSGKLCCVVGRAWKTCERGDSRGASDDKHDEVSRSDSSTGKGKR